MGEAGKRPKSVNGHPRAACSCSKLIATISHLILMTGQELVLQYQNTLGVLLWPHKLHPDPCWRAAPRGRATSTRSLPKSAAPGKKWLLLTDPMGRDFCSKSFPQVSRILRSSDAAESSVAPVTHTLQHLCKHAFAWRFTGSFPMSSDNLRDSAQRAISSRASVLTLVADDLDT